MEGTTGLEEVQSAVCSLHRSKCHETVPRSKIFGWHNVPACQNGKLHVDFIIRQEELSVREQTGRLTVMVEVLPEETRHCAPPVPWVMDARPWDRVSFFQTPQKDTPNYGTSRCHTRGSERTTGRAADIRTEQPPRKAARAQVLCL